MDRTTRLTAHRTGAVGAAGPPTAPGPREDIGPGSGAYRLPGPVGSLHRSLHTGTSTLPSRGPYPHRRSWDSAFIVRGPRRPSPPRNEPETPLGVRAPGRADRVHRSRPLHAAGLLVPRPRLPSRPGRRARCGRPAHRTDPGRRAATGARAGRPGGAPVRAPAVPDTRPSVPAPPGSASWPGWPPHRRHPGGAGLASAIPGRKRGPGVARRGCPCEGDRSRAGLLSVPSMGIDTFDRSDEEGDRG